MDDIYISFWQLLFVNGLIFALMFPPILIIKGHDDDKKKYNKDHKGYSDYPGFYLILYCIVSYLITTFFIN